MTSDAKVGLLLGLVFIFLIAFVINGLPCFSKDASKKEPSANLVSFENCPPGLAAKERKVRQAFEPTASAELQAKPKKNNIRFTAELPKPTLAATNLSEKGKVSSMQPLPVASKEANHNVESSRLALPKIYVVADGDSLSAIAEKVYGWQHGSESISVARIFQANRGILNSPDEIYVGQKLVIPPLSDSQSGKIEKLSRSVPFENTEPVRQRNITAGSTAAAENIRYTVQEGDSLWQIADERLGDGTRYHEIAELNTNILQDEDNLVVGMCLKLPPR
jgi:nucleoid-associated protein YgaU